MDWLKENWFKVGILAVAFLISLSVAYYYVIFLPQKEQARIDQQRQEQFAKEFREQQAKEEAEQALNICIADAEERYSNQWYRECKSRGELTSRCISLNETTFAEYAEENNIPQDKRLSAFLDFEKEKDECSCRLPTAIANGVDDYRDGLKADCFKKYPQN